jgi:hypothetical protein
LPGAIALSLLAPAAAFAGAVITPVPTFPYPNVIVNQPFNASITLFNSSTGQEAQAGVTVTASNLELFPSCPDSVITANNCPNSEAGVFDLSATGTSGAGNCPPGTWTITEPVGGRFSFAPPGAIGLQASQTCTVDFTATALKLPQFDSSLSVPGIQTNQVAAVDAFSPVTGLTVRNSGSSTTGVLLPAPPPGEAAAAPGAKLKISEGCPRIVTATVTGDGIQSVTFFVDGKKQRSVKSPPFTTRIKAVRLSPGRHKLRADVNFTAASGKRAASFTGGFLRCRPRPAPSFTG